MPILYIIAAVLLLAGLSAPYWELSGNLLAVLSSDQAADTTTLRSIFTGPPETEPAQPSGAEENPEEPEPEDTQRNRSQREKRFKIGMSKFHITTQNMPI